MSDEELVSVLFSGCIDSMDLEECPYASESELDNNKIRKICKKCTLDWLQSETEQERKKMAIKPILFNTEMVRGFWKVERVAPVGW